MTLRHCEALLLDYAAGNLSPAQDMILAAYLTLSPEARRFVAACEDIGGAMIAQHCPPADLSAGCLETLLARIDGVEPSHTQDATMEDCGIACCDPIPQSIARLFPAQSRLKWKRAFGGMEWVGCKIEGETARIRMIRADPGFVMPHHTHRGLEITLVLDGAIEDEHGRYVRGDLFLMEPGSSHTQIADHKDGCLCFAVHTAPDSLTEKLSRLLDRFF